MSNDQNTPDFDSMSPEELMAWMESLAKRQGAVEGFTTAADVDVPEVDPDSVDSSSFGEYIPFGWTRDQWETQLAKEADEKAHRKAAPPPPVPQAAAEAAPPPPAPAEPMPAVASASGEPDFDSMSPEQVMAWMESLAKRQGAVEGFTTAADVDVPEVDPSTVDMSTMGEYIPHGWKRDDWLAHLAREEADKAARKAAAAEAAAAEPAADILKAPSLDDLFGSSGVLGVDEDEASELGAPVLDDLFGGADNQLPPLDDDDDFDYDDDDQYDEYDEEETVSAALSSDDPMSWLAGLAAGPGEDLPDLSGFVNADPLPDFDLPSVADEALDPMSWLAGLANNDELDFGLGDDSEESAQPAAEGAGLRATLGDVDPLEWMESLARSQGAESDELVTDANLDIQRPTAYQPDGPGYEEYSFEAGSGVIADETDAVEAPQNIRFSSQDLSDPGAWLDSLASSGGMEFASEPGGTDARSFLNDIDDDDMSEFADLDMSEFELELESSDEESAADVIERLNRAEDVTPEEMQRFFERQFDRAETIGDYNDPDEIDFDAPPIPAEIPDWLQESLDEIGPEPEEDDIAAALGLGEESDLDEVAAQMADILDMDEATLEELPDWLSADVSVAESIADIFAEEEEEIDLGAGEAVAAYSDDLMIDTSDPWVEAFSLEHENEAAMHSWYEEQIQLMQGGELAPSPVPEASVAEAILSASGALQAVEFSPETDVPMGEAQLVPEWLTGVPAASADEADSAALDWLREDTSSVDVDIPDWLAEQVDESIVLEESLPDWLVEADVEIEPEEIPDWLRETIEEPRPAVSVPAEKPLVAQEQARPASFIPAPASAPIQSPAPMTAAALNIDVPSVLQAARAHISSGEVDTALQEFELVIRANSALDEVTQSLQQLADAKEHKKNPAVHRVLGDSLMRQGKLQQALDTYRRALNML